MNAGRPGPDHLSEEELVLLYYNEPGIPDGVRAHFSACTECQAGLRAVARTLDFCTEWTAPEPGAEFERGVWARLAPSLEPRSRGWWISRPRFWAAAAVAALVIAAFIAGHATRREEPPAITAGLSAEARQRILAIALADHLDRAEVLLTEISNAQDSGSSDIAPERERAQELVEEGRLLRMTLANVQNQAAIPLLDDVERLAVEVANQPDHPGPKEREALQQRINSESVLFKVRIVKASLLSQGQRL